MRCAFVVEGFRELAEEISASQKYTHLFVALTEITLPLGARKLRRETWSCWIEPWWILINAHSYDIIVGEDIRVPPFTFFVSCNGQPMALATPFRTQWYSEVAKEIDIIEGLRIAAVFHEECCRNLIHLR